MTGQKNPDFYRSLKNTGATRPVQDIFLSGFFIRLQSVAQDARTV
jgi:hypothetical protein